MTRELTDSPILARPTERKFVELGQWYWMQLPEGELTESPASSGEVLVCCTHVGSNFVVLESPFRSEWRVLLTDFDTVCRDEPDYLGVIDRIIQGRRQHVAAIMREIREEIARLGLSPDAGTDSNRSLSVVSSYGDIGQYKKQLMEAKQDRLPKMFEQISETYEEIACWMRAHVLCMSGESNLLKSHTQLIDDRIFTVQMYAGLVEAVKQVRGGKPAGIDEKIRIMQSTLYMDEECVAGYKAGGIRFDKIGDFDKWLSRAENFHRILPFPRCCVAFRVRRHGVAIDYDGSSFASVLVQIRMRELDKATFLYIRNGSQLWRLTIEDFEFDDSLFPNDADVDLSQYKWIQIDFEKLSLCTQREYDRAMALRKETQEKGEQWERDNPDEPDIFNPHRHFICSTYEPFDTSSVYYDDVTREHQKSVNSYNRVAVILQGILDRSTVLHPHHPISLWKTDSFSQHVELIYDGAMTIHHNAPPSFEEYRAWCNQTLAAGSTTIGQEVAWLERCAAEENERNRGHRSYHEHRLFRPDHDPGPGQIAIIDKWNATKRLATYHWLRGSRRWLSNASIKASITVLDSRLLNLDRYQAGDFRQFYADPRTRQQYMKWAPVLLAAEEWRCGQ